MQTTIATVTRQWQVYLPEEVRRQLDLKWPGQVKMSVRKDHLILTPLKSPVLKLAGALKSVKPKKRVDLTKVRDLIDYQEW